MLQGSDATNPDNYICEISQVTVNKYDIIPTISLKCNGESQDVNVYSHDSFDFDYELNPGTMWGLLVDVYIYAEVAGGDNYFIGEGGTIQLVNAGESVKFATFPIPNTTGLIDLAYVDDLPVNYPDTTYTFKAAFVWPGQDVLNPSSIICITPDLRVHKNDINPTVSLYLSGCPVQAGNPVDVDYSYEPGTMAGAEVDIYLKVVLPDGVGNYVKPNGEFTIYAEPFLSGIELPIDGIPRTDLWQLPTQCGILGGTYTFEGQLYRHGMPDQPVSDLTSESCSLNTSSCEPYITSISPDKGRVETLDHIDLYGGNFRQGAKVSVEGDLRDAVWYSDHLRVWVNTSYWPPRKIGLQVINMDDGSTSNWKYIQMYWSVEYNSGDERGTVNCATDNYLSDGKWILVTDCSDPWILYDGGGIVNFNASDVNTIEIRGANNCSAHDHGQIFYSTSPELNFSESKSKHFTFTSGGGWNVHKITMDGSLWTGTIYALRFDLVDDSCGLSYGLDYIRVYKE